MGKLPPEVMRRVRAFKNEASRLVPIDRLIVFGSYARGDSGPDSDVDMIIVSRTFAGMGFLKRSVGLRLLWRRGVPVDMICLTPEEFEETKRRISLVSVAVEEGVEA
jgi:predicted nucleotidyltransferase